MLLGAGLFLPVAHREFRLGASGEKRAFMLHCSHLIRKADEIITFVIGFLGDVQSSISA
jgi:hypothetical protein